VEGKVGKALLLPTLRFDAEATLLPAACELAALRSLVDRWQESWIRCFWVMESKIKMDDRE
jgi:hypothetical protein